MRRAAVPVILGVTLTATAIQLGTVVRYVGWGELPAAVTGALLPVAFALVAAVVLGQRPGHVIGWLCAVIGVCFAVQGAATTYAEQVHATGASPPLAIAAAWVGTWIWAPAFTSAFLVLPVLFPTGRVLSRRWRVFLGFAVVAPALQILGIFVTPGPMHPGERPLWDNPLGLEAGQALTTAVDLVLQSVFIPLLVLMVVAVVQRYRRAAPVERAQLKWYLSAVVLTAVGFAVSMIPAMGAIRWIGDGIFFLALPVSIGVAVLRYRLYDIDRVISRTLAYALITGTLVGVYAGGVMALTPLVAGMGGGSELAVAASTLAVAAAFGPVRRRVQSAVDHRFNRTRYDARRTVEAFASGLREEVDLDELSAGLVAAVRETVEPTATTLWLRSGGAR
jgi:hypothetical protein